MDHNYCWKALKCTKALQFETTPAWKDLPGYNAVFIKVNEALGYTLAFPKLTKYLGEPLITFPGMDNGKFIQESVFQALITQAEAKATGLDKMNFQVLQVL